MKKFLKFIIPSVLRQKIREIRLINYLIIVNGTIKNYFYDFKRYIKYSGTINGFKSKNHHEARIIHAYHNIEKGLSLKNTRIGFGKEKVKYLIRILDEYRLKYGWNDTCKVALNVLDSYYNFNLSNGLKNEELKKEILRLKNTIPSHSEKISGGGIVHVKREDIERAANIDFKSFAYNRYSIRNFKEGEINIDKIKEAVEIALKTPSVCNRQTCRIHIFTGEKKTEILKYQNGNRGFGDTAGAICLITSRLDSFMGSNERNQAYIDGGMFSMSMVYALHSLGLGTCCLNLSIDYNVDVELRRVANIDDSESVIMMIAVGEIPDELDIANSYRKSVNEIMTINN